MSDIFISYSKSDRAKAQVLAKALEREGWSVWWDPKIPPGKTFDEVIEQALDSARCVVVLWSKKSVISDWVKTEAAEGKRRGILIPALVEDDVKIPLDFRRLHASRLADWNGEESGHLEFEELKNAVGELLGGPTSVAESTSKRSLNDAPVGAKTEGIPEKVSEHVQADPKTRQSQTIKNVREMMLVRKILPARVVLFVLAGIVGVLATRYAWIHWAKCPRLSRRRILKCISIPQRVCRGPRATMARMSRGLRRSSTAGPRPSSPGPDRTQKSSLPGKTSDTS